MAQGRVPSPIVVFFSDFYWVYVKPLKKATTINFTKKRALSHVGVDKLIAKSL